VLAYQKGQQQQVEFEMPTRFVWPENPEDFVLLHYLPVQVEALDEVGVVPVSTLLVVDMLMASHLGIVRQDRLEVVVFVELMCESAERMWELVDCMRRGFF
jgi:hypothetical protein